MVYETYILVQRHQSDSLTELRTDLLIEVGARGALASKNAMHRIDMDWYGQINLWSYEIWDHSSLPFLGKIEFWDPFNSNFSLSTWESHPSSSFSDICVIFCFPSTPACFYPTTGKSREMQKRISFGDPSSAEISNLASSSLSCMYTVFQTSQNIRIMSSVTLNCQVTKIVLNSFSQLPEL